MFVQPFCSEVTARVAVTRENRLVFTWLAFFLVLYTAKKLCSRLSEEKALLQDIPVNPAVTRDSCRCL